MNSNNCLGVLGGEGYRKPFSDDEETKAFRKLNELEEGSDEWIEQRNRIVEHNMLLLAKIAGGLSKNQLDYEKNFQNGYFGLATAVMKFDPEMGTKFSTYAVWWIRQAVFRKWPEDVETVHIPQYIHESVRKNVNRQRKPIEDEPEDENNSYSDVVKRRIAQYSEIASDGRLTVTYSLQQKMPLIDEEHYDELKDVNRVFDRLQAEELLGIIKSTITEMEIPDNQKPSQSADDNMRNYRIFVSRVVHGRTLQQIGDEHDLSRERVRQICEMCARHVKNTLLDMGYMDD